MKWLDAMRKSWEQAKVTNAAEVNRSDLEGMCDRRILQGLSGNERCEVIAKLSGYDSPCSAGDYEHAVEFVATNGSQGWMSLDIAREIGLHEIIDATALRACTKLEDVYSVCGCSWTIRNSQPNNDGVTLRFEWSRGIYKIKSDTMQSALTELINRMLQDVEKPELVNG